VRDFNTHHVRYWHGLHRARAAACLDVKDKDLIKDFVTQNGYLPDMEQVEAVRQALVGIIKDPDTETNITVVKDGLQTGLPFSEILFSNDYLDISIVEMSRYRVAYCHQLPYLTKVPSKDFFRNGLRTQTATPTAMESITSACITIMSHLNSKWLFTTPEFPVEYHGTQRAVIKGVNRGNHRKDLCILVTCLNL